MLLSVFACVLCYCISNSWKTTLQIKMHKTNAILLLVGDGPLKENIMHRAEELRIADDIVFAGIRSDVNKILSAMDVFVFPSLYEGMPNTVIEVQTAGIPCLISDSITREANVNGLVEFISIKIKPEK